MHVLAQTLQSAAALVLALAPVPACLAWSLARARAEGRRPAAVELVEMAVLWCGLQMGLATLLGVFHVLHPFTLLVAALLLALAGAWLFTEIRFHTPPAVTGLPRSSQQWRASDALLLATIGALGAALVLRLLVRPTTGYDSWAYHLPAIARFYQDHSLAMIDPADQISRFPYGWELLCGASTFPFGGDFVVSVPNILAWLLWGTASYALARRLGAGRSQGLTAAAILLSIPAVVIRLDAVQVDIALAAFFTAGLLMLLDAAARRSRWSLATALICAGLMLAVKLSGFVYVAVLAAAGVALELGRRLPSERTAREGTKASDGSRRELPRRASILVAHPLRSAVVLALLVGAFWYLRNLVQTGNPLGFIEVRLGGVTLLAGYLEPDYLKDTTLAAVYGRAEAASRTLYHHIVARDIGWPFLGLAALGCVLMPVAVLARKTRPVEALVLLLTIAATLVLYATTPGGGALSTRNFQLTEWTTHGLRFGFPVLGLAAAAGGVALGLVRFPAMLSIPLCLGSAALALRGVSTASARAELPGELVDSGFAIFSVAVGFVVFVAISILAHGGPLGRRARWRLTSFGAACAAAAVIVAVGPPLQSAREAQRVKIYGSSYVFLEKALGNRGVVGALATRHPYVLQGHGFARRVIDVSPISPSFEEWRGWVDAEGVDLIALAPGHTIALKVEGRNRMVQWLKDRRRSRYFRLAHGENPREDIMLYWWTDPSPTSERPAPATPASSNGEPS